MIRELLLCISVHVHVGTTEIKDIMVFSFHCSLHYDTECELGEDEYLKTFSEARNQDILGKDQMKPSPRILIKPHLQRSPCLAATSGTLL